MCLIPSRNKVNSRMFLCLKGSFYYRRAGQCIMKCLLAVTEEQACFGAAVFGLCPLKMEQCLLVTGSGPSVDVRYEQFSLSDSFI